MTELNTVKDNKMKVKKGTEASRHIGTKGWNRLAAMLILIILTQTATAVKLDQNAFNSGELSPFFQRSDHVKYYGGCRTLENFNVLSLGGAERRPGTKFIADAKAGTGIRLIPFVHSGLIAYVMEFGNQYARFYRDGAVVGAPYEITTPYGPNDLFEIKFIQSANWMYLTHPDYIMQKLVRTSNASWTMSDVSLERGPFLDQNTTDITVTPTEIGGGGIDAGASVTLAASSALWNANHVGAHWQITHTLAADSVSGGLSGNGSSSTVAIQLSRTFDFSTHGTWTGTVTLQRSFDGSIWKDVLPVHYENDGNVTYTDIETVADATYRVTMTDYSEGTINYNLTARSFDLNGVVEITAFSTTQSVTATVEVGLGAATATKVWAESAFSDDEGWPACLAFYEERLVFAATKNNPQTLWFSQTDDWEKFKIGDLADDALIYTIASDQVNAIRWMAPQKSLLLGTISAEWQFSASGQNEALTPTTRPRALRQSQYGSGDIQGIPSSNVILFAQGRRKIRELTYSFELDSWVAPDLTVLSEHITKSGIVEMEFQKIPHPILWCVRDDGELAVMTYMREQNVVGWTRATTWTSNMTVMSEIESVAVIPGDEEDEVWLAVKRVIDGSTVRYIEQLQPFDWGDDQADAWFVDGGAGETVTAGAGGICYETETDYPQLQAITEAYVEDRLDNIFDDIVVVDPQGVTEISNESELLDIGVGSPLDGSYYLSADIVVTGIKTEALINGDFTGIFDGRGHKITYVLDDGGRGTENALFLGIDHPALVQNLLVDATMTVAILSAPLAVGIDLDYTADVDIKNVHCRSTINIVNTWPFPSQGSKQSPTSISGFVANVIQSGFDFAEVRFTDCTAVTTITWVSANDAAHELAGFLTGFSVRGCVFTNCHTRGTIDTSANDTGIERPLYGGFTYEIEDSTFTNCSANVDIITGGIKIGGFIAFDEVDNTFTRCFALGDVTSSVSFAGVGGFSATSHSSSVYTDCYAKGNVTQIGDGITQTAGFVGDNSAAITNAYSIGLVTATGDGQGDFVGGFLAVGDGSQTSCYWDTTTSEQATSAGSETGKTTAQMKTQSTYTNWDFDTVWEMPSDCATPPVYYWDGVYGGTGFSHLEGETIAILGDGIALDKQVVSSGTFALELDGVAQEVTKVIAGLPYNSKLKPMKLELPNSTTLTGATKRITDITLRLHETLDIKVGPSWTEYDEMEFIYDENGNERDPNELFTGDMLIDFDGGHEVGGDVYIQHDDPTPCTILKMVTEFESY